MKTKAPNKAERDWMDTISQLGCIVCRNEGMGPTPAMVHHIIDTGRRMGHLYTIPLCMSHHHAGIDDERATSRHPYRRRFEARYGTELQLLEQVRELVRRAA